MTMTMSIEFRPADDPPDRDGDVQALVVKDGRHALVPVTHNKNGWLVAEGWTVLAWTEGRALTADEVFRQLFGDEAPP